jgi:hypothetical protein
MMPQSILIGGKTRPEHTQPNQAARSAPNLDQLRGLVFFLVFPTGWVRLEIGNTLQENQLIKPNNLIRKKKVEYLMKGGI